MTTIATLPAGKYNLVAAHMDHRKLLIPLNAADVLERGENMIKHVLPIKSTGSFEMNGRAAVLVELVGCEAVRDYAYETNFISWTSEGPVEAGPYMAIVPVDTIEHDRLATGEYGWIAFETDEPFEIRYDDLVLTVGDLTLDLRHSFPLEWCGVKFLPGGAIYEAFSPMTDFERFDGRIEMTPDRIARLGASDDADAQKLHGILLSRRYAEQGGQIWCGHANDGRHAVPLGDLNLRTESGRILRSGTPLQRMFSLSRFTRYQVRGPKIDRDLIAQVEAIGGDDAEEVVRDLRIDLRKRYDNTIFLAHLDKKAA